MSKPRMAARSDWMTVGSFSPERFTGEERKEYEAEQDRIEREWDNQPN
ncbi:hypothetical protein RA263_14545 [Pseudomonas syringae pv. tagetis]|uniref:Uncharacterized protein n=1 Tax=Pseudomonas syringae pv. tagetis TaxID=129140 RepID=A0A0N8T2U1_9PSED|nr:MULTISPECIES: hypothetical protein [Pseudomonas syringae group]KPY83736.1 Uncharacterized protein ALO44_00164 [Pseudomonas syringae pv. tagetis]MBI6727674.1 hypothetical protein [Pseudomonas amygdali]MBI6810713.1 hypothetical protein [Pseudomonas amygdali]RMW08787.1 hypothetical protein ALO98_200419 [Pseudomonas syringae pv. tagetis]RMW25842.1 hypothetical protein ALO97_00140 [Pseudomonas syringae pv. tagetis]